MLLDLFCGAGGAGAGYHAAGFDVVGVDIRPQPDYPFPFLQADALTVDLTGYDVVHTSPPCQRYCRATPAGRRDQHPDLVAPMRQRLIEAAASPGGPRVWVIENVPGAPLVDPVTVCGDSLRLGVRRHRLFESNRPLAGTPCWHDRPAPAVAVYGTYGQRRKGTDTGATTDQARTAMGIDWMPWPALTQAIPPAYTHWLGVQILTRHLADDAHAAGQTSRGAGHVQVASVTPEPADDTTHQVPSITGDATPSAAFRHLAAGDETPSTGFRHCRCGQPLPARPATGRWPRYCSHACRQAAYRDRTSKETAA
ncbi:hypothetical protein Raf01_96500 [Rugosimonospora africana]|uniref:DNA (cytosine-5-)-methyltransferase n=1 Tax=Rugosimonospora africana TaxID=556532 RepID=A0A8J3VX47_9ACTN|nr:hypothetical protein Raf01_96500 [Rugosimonospora africana]